MNRNNDYNSIDEKYEKILKKRKKLRNIKSFLIILILILVVTLLIVTIKKKYDDMATIKYEDYELYQYFSGAKVNYTGIVSLERTNNISSIKSKDINVDLGDIPIYFQNIDNEVLVPEKMELIFPNIKNKSYKVNYFTKFISDTVDNIETVLISNNKDQKYLGKSFLYNGEDLYFFPYSVTVTINNNDYNLSPLSYIIVVYKGSVEVYDKLNDKYIIIDNVLNDVIARFDNYKINLSTDMIMYKNENRLLIKNIDLLETYTIK